jgi:Flp pilus assembly protein TadD
MRPAVIAMLILCCCLGTGCESLNRMTRWPGKSAATNQEQLVQDLKRRQAAEQQATISPSGSLLAKQTEQGRQQANFPPSGTDPESQIEFLLSQAGQAERANQNATAKGYYDQVLQIIPQHPRAHHRLGVLADQEGRYVEAQNHYQIALSLEPNNSVLLSDIGYSYYSQDRLNEAEQYLQEALRIQPSNNFARNNLAQVYGRRAQQTGSEADMQLAREQFAKANGEMEGDEQLQRMLPAATVEESKRFPNPFKKLLNRDKPQVAQTGSTLQAPDPALNKPTQKFIQSFEQLKQEAIARGEYSTSSGTDQTQNPRSAAMRNVPPDRLNDELERIDNEAQIRRELALRELNPYSKRRLPSQTDGQWERGEIRQTGGFEDSLDAMGRRGQMVGPPTINPSRPSRRGSSAKQSGDDRSRSGYGPANYGDSAPEYAGGNQRLNETSNPQMDSGDLNSTWPNSGNPADPANNQDWNQPSASPMARSWPDTAASPTQYLANGETWNGTSNMPQDRVAPGSEGFGSGFESNQPYQQISNRGNFDHPNMTRQYQGGGPARSERGNLIPAPPGWGGRHGENWDRDRMSSGANQFNRVDDGRQTAAQLALDAGMGEMFPGHATEQTTGPSRGNNRRQGRAPYGPRNSQPDSRDGREWSQSSGDYPGGDWPGVDPHNQTLSAPMSTPDGMQPGGAGMMSPADYAPRQVGYQNGGYPRGAVDSQDEYNQGGNGMNGRRGTNNRGPNFYDARPANYEAGYDNGAINQGSGWNRQRPGGDAPLNHGAPPMYFGR